MERQTSLALLTVVLFTACVVVADAQTNLTEQVRSAETAFAKSMADRDAAAFASLIGDEAVFFGNQSVMRGKTAVVAGWKRFFDGASAPFSWKPAEVEVLALGHARHDERTRVRPSGAPHRHVQLHLAAAEATVRGR